MISTSNHLSLQKPSVAHPSSLPDCDLSARLGPTFLEPCLTRVVASNPPRIQLRPPIHPLLTLLSQITRSHSGSTGLKSILRPQIVSHGQGNVQSVPPYKNTQVDSTPSILPLWRRMDAIPTLKLASLALVRAPLKALPWIRLIPMEFERVRRHRARKPASRTRGLIQMTDGSCPE